MVGRSEDAEDLWARYDSLSVLFRVNPVYRSRNACFWQKEADRLAGAMRATMITAPATIELV